jgi:hypothetical protein
VTGKWDEWKDKMNNLGDIVKNTLSPMTQLGDQAEEVDKKLQKQLRTLQETINLATRDYQETMGEWVKDHDKKITELKKDVASLTSTYNKETEKIKKKFNDTIRDMTISHKRKTEDLVEQINEETSKGIWADQTRIRELKKELQRENEDYEASFEERQLVRDEDLDERKSEYDENLAEKQVTLNEELALEQTHAVALAEARKYPLLDAIAQIERTYTEKLASVKQQLDDLADETIATSATMAKALQIPPQVGALQTELATEQMKKSYQDMGYAAKMTALEIGAQYQNTIMGIIDDLSELIALPIFNAISNKPMSPTFAKNVQENKFLQTGAAVQEWLAGFFGVTPTQVSQFLNPFDNPNSGNAFGLPQFEDGGVVPGASGQAVPIIAHAGETVVPANQSPITIQINNPIVRSDSDIQAIAREVESVLSRQTYLKRFK